MSELNLSPQDRHTVSECREFIKLGEKVRLNAALFYDVINAENSPFRTSYFFKVKNQAGQIVRTLPIIYRVTFFIPIGSSK